MLLGLPSGAFHYVNSGAQRIKEAIERVHDLGFPLVELTADVEAYFPGRMRLAVMNAKRPLKYTVHLPFIVPSIGSLLKEAREYTEKILARVIESLSVFDPIYYVLHPLSYGEERAYFTMFKLEREKLEERILEMYEIIGDYIGLHEKLLLENLEVFPLERRMDMLEGYGINGCLDVGHAILQGYDPVEVIKEAKPKEIHLHDVFVKTFPHGRVYQDHMPPGVGVVSFEEILEAAKEASVVILEVYKPQYALLAAERAKNRGLIRRGS